MEQRGWEKVMWVGLIVLTIARMMLGAFSELTPDEAYYYLWTEHLDWSYYSKGPGIALALKLSTSIFGATSLGIRFLSPLLGLGTSILLFRLGSQLFGRRSAIWAVVLLNLTPIFNAGSVVMTIDPLMLFFWVAAMWAFWNALHTAERPLPWWIGAGCFLGCGFLAKYTVLLVVVSMVIYLLFSRERRREFGRSGFWAMLGTCILFLIPVLVWNSRNQWITVRHLLERANLIPRLNEPPAGAETSGPLINPMELLEYLGLHFGVYSPLVFLGLLAAFVVAFFRFGRNREETFIGAFSLPTLLMYFVLSLKSTGEVNWTAPGFLALGLVAPVWFTQWNANGALKRWLAGTAIGLSILMTLLALNPDLLRIAGLSWDYDRDPFGRLRGWKTSTEAIEKLIAEMTEETGEAPFLIGNKYQVAAICAFYLSPDVKVLVPSDADPPVHMVQAEQLGMIQNQFSFWPDYHSWRKDSEEELTQPFLGRNALYITLEVDRESARPVIEQSFRKTELVGTFQIHRRRDLLREWRVFACYDYQMLHQ